MVKEKKEKATKEESKDLNGVAKANLAKKLGVITADQLAPAEYIQTGFSRIDSIWGDHRRGLRRGTSTIIYGNTGSGKSTMVYQIIANVQKQGLRAIVFNVENSFDPQWAQHLGVNLGTLYIKPIQENLDATLQTVKDVVATGYFDLVVIDSLHALGTAREMDRSIEEENPVGALAQKVTLFVRTIGPSLEQTKAHMIVIGQARMNIDQGNMNMTGGKAIEHAPDIIIQMNRSDAKARVPVDKDDKPIGHVALMFGEKVRGPGNKCRFEMPFINGDGFSETRCVIEQTITNPPLATRLFGGVGPYFVWKNKDGEDVKLHGKFQVLQYFDDNPKELVRLSEMATDESSSPISPSTGE